MAARSSFLERARAAFIGERNPTTGLHYSIFGPSFEEAWGAPPATFLEIGQLPRKLAATAFRRRSIAETYDNNKMVNAGGEMRRSLNAVSYALLGIGTIIATGIFSFLPFVYSIITGPSVVIALILSGGTAALSALCYCEFGCEYPVVGGGMAYTMLVFGELPAMLCAINLFIDYIFGTASTARNVSAYWTQLFTKGEPKSNLFQYKKIPATLETNGKIDYVALLVTLGLTIVAAYSTKAFDHSNGFLQFFHIGLVIVTFLAAFSNKHSSNSFFWRQPQALVTQNMNHNVTKYNATTMMNYTTTTTTTTTEAATMTGPLWRHTGLFDPALGTPSTMVVTGASNIFFVFVGYDVIALGAEEAAHRNSVANGMVLCIFTVMGLYMLMAVALVRLIPYTLAHNSSSVVCLYGYAFELNGMRWARYIVALCASIGCITSTGIGVFGMARVLQCFARERLLPPWMGMVHPKYGTPVLCTVFSGLVVALLSFFLDFKILANMTSIGTLIMFWFVGLALAYRRYAPGVAEETGCDGGDRHKSLPLRLDPFGSLFARLSPEREMHARRMLVTFWMTIITASPIVFSVFFNGGASGTTHQPFTLSQTTTTDVAGKVLVPPWFWPGLTDKTRNAVLIAMAVIWAGANFGLMLTCPIQYVPATWHVPWYLLPWLPTTSIWTITMLVGGFGGFPADYSRVGWCVLAMTIIYLVYGVHASYHRTFVLLPEEKKHAAAEVGEAPTSPTQAQPAGSVEPQAAAAS